MLFFARLSFLMYDIYVGISFPKCNEKFYLLRSTNFNLYMNQFANFNEVFPFSSISNGFLIVIR